MGRDPIFLRSQDYVHRVTVKNTLILVASGLRKRTDFDLFLSCEYV